MMLQAEVDKFLDLSREAFSDTTERIYVLADQYKTEFDLPDLQTSYQTRRGFSLVVPSPLRPDDKGRGGDSGISLVGVCFAEAAAAAAAAAPCCRCSSAGGFPGS